MAEEIILALQKFNAALIALKMGANEAENELEKDGVIQRFEFTFELLWKTLRIFMEEQGVLVMTPRESLKAAFRAAIIQDEPAFLGMLEDRNKTSHIYDREESERIYVKIKEVYLPAMEDLLLKLNKGHTT